MPKTLEELRGMGIQEVYQALPVPDPRILSLDITYLYARVRAIEEMLEEKLDVNSNSMVMKYWLDGVWMKISK